MGQSWISNNYRGLAGLVAIIAAAALALFAMMPARKASAEDVEEALKKANDYIETAKTTERALDSWDRYREWVNMKTGPTGKERYISYGMYELSDVPELLEEARKAADAKPKVPKLDAAMLRYLDAYEALAPSFNRAAEYYDSKGYESDNAAEGQALHKKMVPLATKFIAEREAMMAELRPFVRDVQRQELTAMKARDGRKAAWQVGNVLHAVDRVFDVFPRIRPEPMSNDVMEQMISDLGPESSGAQFDQVIAGVVPPKSVTIDVKRYGEELEKYAEAVDEFDKFSGEKPDDFDEFKEHPRAILEMLREFQKPLVKSAGKPFDGDGQMFSQIVQRYYEMFNDGNGMVGSQLRHLQ